MFKNLMLTAMLMLFTGNAMAQVDDALGPEEPIFVIAPCNGCNMGAPPSEWNDATRLALFHSQYGDGWKYSSLYRDTDSTHVSIRWYRYGSLGATTGGVHHGLEGRYVSPQVYYRDVGCFLTVNCGDTSSGSRSGDME